MPQSWDDLPSAFAAANRAAMALGTLAESIERSEPNPAKRAALIMLSVAVGGHRDRLHGLKLDMQRAGFLNV